jgi:serine/threonine-protein kinase
LQLIVLIGSVPFARYNLKLCRGDTRGALRLGLFATVVCMASWVICGTHVATAEEADLFMTAAMRAVFSGITLALTYISFEPFVRRKWPETIVSWSRVLVGGFRDPLVGRDVLIGTLLGVIGAVTQGFGSQLYQIMGIRAVRIGTDPLTLLGGTHLTGQVLFLIIDSLNKSLGVLFLIFLFRTILRKQWLAAGLIVIVLAAMQGTNSIDPRIGWPVSFLFFGLLVFTLMRFGLLALTLTIFVSILMGQFPIGTDFSVWYSGAMAFTFLAVLALAAYGFRTALAGQSLIKEA